MNYAAQYVKQKNIWRKLFNEPQLDVSNLSQADIRELIDSIGCDLSPENLTCDGELRGDRRRRARMLNGARNELLKLAA